MTHALPDTSNPRVNLLGRLESKGVVVGTKERPTTSLVVLVVEGMGRLFAVRLRCCRIGRYSFLNEQFDSKFTTRCSPTKAISSKG